MGRMRCAVLAALLLAASASGANVTGDVSEAAALANLTAANDLWSTLLRDCKEPTVACVRASLYDFLKGTLDYPSDLRFTNFLNFPKNTQNYTATHTDDSANNDTFYEDESALEGITRSLHDNTVKFFMTHDVELQLPDTFFHGSTLKISPRSIDDSGAIVKLEVMPQLSNEVGEGRLFFKKIKKFISERLVYALLAILLVIKLLAAKFLFILPMILGAATAKKILIKILLFIFPALHHLFKLCAYYPTQAKYHHHKHLISHIHSVAHKYPPHHGPHHHHDGGAEVIAPHAGGPPSLHHGGHYDDHDLHHEHHDYYDPHDNDLGISFYPGSPGIGNDIISHRHDPHEDEISWGQGHSTAAKRKKIKKPPTSSELENMVLKTEKEALIKARLQKEKQRIQEENLRLQEQLNKALKMQEKLKLQQAFVHSKISNKNISPPSPYLQSPPVGRPPPVASAPVGSVAPIGPVTPVGSVAPLGPVAPVGPVAPIGPVISVGSRVPVGLGGSIPSSGSVTPVASISNSLIKVPPGVALPQASQIYNAYQEIHQKNNKQQSQNQPEVQSQSSIKQPVYRKPEKPPESHNVQPSFSGSVEIVKSVEPELPKADKKIYQAASITFDPFYSPILEKIDKLFHEVDFVEEPCKERLICSMYKNPTKFSPRSNLLSAELSRDPEELQKPKTTNAAVIRFYKYVQAARDGQDGRDCLRLYPACTINTEL